MLIEVYDEKGNYSLGKTGGKANAFNDAILLMNKLTGESNFNLYSISMNDYLLSYDDGKTEYVIPFNQSDRLLPDYYEVEKLKQLPTAEDYLKTQKEKLIEIKAEIGECQKIHPDDLMYGVDYYVVLLPKKNSIIFNILLAVTVGIIVLLVYLSCKREKIKRG